MFTSRQRKTKFETVPRGTRESYCKVGNTGVSTYGILNFGNPAPVIGLSHMSATDSLASSGQGLQKKESDHGSGSYSYGSYGSRIFESQMRIHDPWILFHGPFLKSFRNVRNQTENKISTQLTDVITPVPLAIGMPLLISSRSIL